MECSKWVQAVEDEIGRDGGEITSNVTYDERGALWDTMPLKGARG